MAQIRAIDLSFEYENGKKVFDHIFFEVDTNWKIGLIGRNGRGKTTLLRLLQGKYSFSGSIISPIKYGIFPFEISVDDSKKCFAEILEKNMVEYEVWKVNCELSKLNADLELLFRPYETLSYGEQTKVQLAALFSCEEKFYLIDEPTNHLDEDSREIVTEYLINKSGYIVVSHDRTLLDRCTNHILAINRNSIEVQNGNFSVWYDNKEKNNNFILSQKEKYEKDITKLKCNIERKKQWAQKNENSKIGFDPIKEHDRCKDTRAIIGKKTKKMNKSVKNYIGRVEKTIDEKSKLIDDVEKIGVLSINPLIHHKKCLIEIREYNFGYTSEKMILRDVNLSINQNDVVVVCGRNGAGKSSLINAIYCKINEKTISNVVENGQIECASSLEVGYISQNMECVRGTVDQFCADYHIEQELFFTVMAQLDVKKEVLENRLETLSDGQKKKVQIAKCLVKPAHIYIWDEPLNYLDIYSRIQLERLIKRHNLTMIIVEHDKFFCDSIATKYYYLN